jgi:hypothetical protein
VEAGDDFGLPRLAPEGQEDGGFLPERGHPDRRGEESRVRDWRGVGPQLVRDPERV